MTPVFSFSGVFTGSKNPRWLGFTNFKLIVLSIARMLWIPPGPMIVVCCAAAAISRGLIWDAGRLAEFALKVFLIGSLSIPNFTTWRMSVAWLTCLTILVRMLLATAQS